MKVNILAVGKIKEKYLKDAILEYTKRLSKFCDLNIVEIDEVSLQVENDSNIKKVLETEGNLIEKKIKDLKSDKAFVFALDINGKELSTLDFHQKMEEIKLNGIANVIFIIGGSYGIDERIKKMVDFRFSFSRLTFPHQLFRVILLEQIYRIFKIEHNEPYHK